VQDLSLIDPIMVRFLANFMFVFPLKSKNMILDQAFKYITEMKRQNDELLLNGGNNEQGKYRFHWKL